MTQNVGGIGRVFRIVLGGACRSARRRWSEAMRSSGHSLLWTTYLIVAAAGCSARPAQDVGTAGSAVAIERVAWDAIARGAPVIDVRTDEEFRQGHLPGAVNIPYDQVPSRLGELPADKSRPIVLYCRSGRRSGIARESLEALGFTNAINAGGYETMMRARPQDASR